MLAGLSAYYLVRDDVEAPGPPTLDERTAQARDDAVFSAVTARLGGLLHDADVQEAVDTVARHLAEHSLVDDTPVRVEVHVLVREDTAVAVALASGDILVTRGALAPLGSPELVAGLLAHEIGHVLAGVDLPEDTISSVGDEMHADRLAARVLGEAGYPPAALVAALEALERAGAAGFRAAHPTSPERRTMVARLVEEMASEVRAREVR